MNPKPKKKIHGYDGPSGAYAVIDGRILPLAGDPVGLVSLADSAMLTGLGFTAKAAEFEAAIASQPAAA